MDAETYKTIKTRKMLSTPELAKDIYLKLDNIHATLGYILAKTKDLPEPVKDLGEQTDDEIDARDAEGTVLPVE